MFFKLIINWACWFQTYLDFFERHPGGVILFSLGSTGFHKDVFPPRFARELVRTFEQLGRGVIMRMSEELLGNILGGPIPDNILVANWIPQNDLLGKCKIFNDYLLILSSNILWNSASGNVSVFISHCGSFGSQESIYHGVPIAAMPLFEDQFYNAQRIVDKDLGLMLPSHKTATAEEMVPILQNLLSNEGWANVEWAPWVKITHKLLIIFRIKAEVRRISRLWRGDLNSGLDIATFWVERVMKTKDPRRLDFLKIQDGHLYWWQFYSLDVILFLAGTLLAAILLGRKALGKRYRVGVLKKLNWHQLRSSLKPNWEEALRIIP